MAGVLAVAVKEGVSKVAEASKDTKLEKTNAQELKLDELEELGEKKEAMEPNVEKAKNASLESVIEENKEKLPKIEEELENHRRHVKESTRLLLRGYTDRDDVEQEYGKKVADEAYEQCEKTKERLTNVQQKGETVARELDATLLGIDINNHNIPDDIVTEVDELKNNLSDLVADIGDIEQRVAAGNVGDCDVVGSQLDKFRVRIRDLVQYYNKWKEQELKRETQRASASDIAQLAQLFNS